MRHTLSAHSALALFLWMLFGQTSLAGESAPDAPDALMLEQLLDATIIGASKYPQKQSQAAAAVSVITRQEIKTFGWRTLAEALNSLPGIHITYDRQYAYLGTRGFGLPGDYNTRVLLTLDGNRMNDLVYDGAAMGVDLPIDLDLIERIEYIPGPGGAVYGQNAMFGVVNLVTRTGAGVGGGELAGSWQSLQSAGSGRLTWGGALDNGGEMLISASGYQARGEDHFFDYGGSGISGVARGLDGEEDHEFFANISKGAWLFQLALGDRLKEDPTAAYFSDPLVSGQYERDRYLLSQLQYHHALDHRSEITGRLFLGKQRYNGKFIYDGAPYLSAGAGDWYGLELRFLSSATDDHKWIVGLEAQNNYRIDQTDDDSSTLGLDTAIRESGYRTGIFVQDDWRFGDGLTATLGLRLDQDHITGAHPSPRVALHWQPDFDNSFKLLYGRAYRSPNSYERDYDDGFSLISNPNLDEETIDTLELVANHRLGPDLSLRASVYHWVIRDLITLGLSADEEIPQYQSGGRVHAAGAELSAEKRWRWGGRLQGSLAWQDAGYSDGRDLINSPDLVGKLNFSTPLPVAGLSLGFELRYCDERLTLAGSRLDGYWEANLNFTAARLARGLDLSLGIYNLFDEAYAHPAAETNWQNAIEQDGRSVRLKLDYRF